MSLEYPPQGRCKLAVYSHKLLVDCGLQEQFMSHGNLNYDFGDKEFILDTDFQWTQLVPFGDVRWPLVTKRGPKIYEFLLLGFRVNLNELKICKRFKKIIMTFILKTQASHTEYFWLQTCRVIHLLVPFWAHNLLGTCLGLCTLILYAPKILTAFLAKLILKINCPVIQLPLFYVSSKSHWMVG